MYKPHEINLNESLPEMIFQVCLVQRTNLVKVYLKMKIVILYSSLSCSKPESIYLFYRTQKYIFWRMKVTKQYQSIFVHILEVIGNPKFLSSETLWILLVTKQFGFPLHICPYSRSQWETQTFFFGILRRMLVNKLLGFPLTSHWLPIFHRGKFGLPLISIIWTKNKMEMNGNWICYCLVTTIFNIFIFHIKLTGLEQHERK